MTAGQRGLQMAWAVSIPAAALVLTALLGFGETNRDLFLLINGFGAHYSAALWSNLTVLGDSLVLLTLSLLFVGRYPRLIWSLIIAALVGTFLVHGLKEVIDTVRPAAVFPPELVHVIGPSLLYVAFPSGHTAAVFTLVGLLCMQRDIRPVFKAALLIWGLMVGISRITVGAHWPIDVAGGAMVGWIAAMSGLWLAPRVHWGMTARAQRIFAGVLVLCAAALLLFHDSGYQQARTLEVVLALGALLVAYPKVRGVFREAAAEGLERKEVVSERVEEPARKGWRGVTFRLVVTGLIFWLILRSIDFDQVSGIIEGANPRLLELALFFQLFSTALASYRWHLVMRPLGFDHPFGFYLRSYFKGSFFNQGLPTSIGGDAIRVIDVAREGNRTLDAFYGVLVDRLLGLVGLLILNLVANLFAPDLLPAGVFHTINLVVGGGLFGFALFWGFHRMGPLARLPLLGPVRAISQRIGQVLEGIGEVTVQLGLAITVHLFSLVAIYLLGLAVGMKFGLGTYLVIVPPVILLTLVPVSLAGWGVREGAMIGLFMLLGAVQAQVLSMSILYGLILIISSFPGFYVYLTGKYRI